MLITIIGDKATDMRKSIVIILFLFLACPVLAQDRVDLTAVFHPEKTSTEKAADIMYAVALIGIVADWRTTRDIARYYETINEKSGRTHEEAGFLLSSISGPHPTPREVNLYFLAMAGLTVWINNYEPWENDRLFHNSIIATVFISAATMNVHAGMELKF